MASAWKTVSFNQNGGSGGETRTLYYYTSTASVNDGWYTLNSSSGTKVTRVQAIPKKAGYVFKGYKTGGGATLVSSDGVLLDTMSGSYTDATVTAFAKWEELPCPEIAIEKNDGTGGTDLIYYDSANQKFYFDYPFATEFTSSSSIVIPTKTRYRFLGCYSTNSTSGTLLINPNGTPTAAFFNLAPSEVTTIYAQWVEVSKAQTINSEYGTYQYKTFYQSLTADSDGKYGYYSDDLCQTRIYGIPVPTRELYQWNGLSKSSAQDSTTKQPTGVRYANADGTFTSAFLGLAPEKRTIYGSFWFQVSVKLTLAGDKWTIATKTYYLDKTNGGVYSDWLLQTQLSVLPVPVRAGYRFLGYYSGTSTSSPGTQYVDASGNILSALTALKAKTTINALGRAASYTLTLDPNGGTTTEPTIYYDATSGEEAFIGANSAVKTSVAVPTYTGNSFLGYFTEEQGGTQVVGTSGNILSSWVPTANATVYAQWGIDVSIIDVDAGDGSGGTTRFYHRTTTQKFYSDAELTTEITSIEVPSLQLHNLNGIYTTDGDLAVNASGVIQSTFHPTDEFVTLSATYTRFAYQMSLPGGSGTMTLSAVYHAPGGSTWYSDLGLTTVVTNVGVPTRTGYTYGGCTYGSTTVIDTSGNILSAAAVDEDYTASGVWTAKTYTLIFNGNGATPSFPTKIVTYNAAIGNLPTLTNIPSKKTFDEWKIGGIGITAATVWTFDGDRTAYAAWETYFGNVKDWFNLASATLIPESSDSGESHQFTCAYNATSESPATETSAIWRNPRVTYRVVGQMTLGVTLGAAFAAVNSGSSAPTISGYMISSVEVHTAIGEAPTVTVSAVANEGYTQRASGSRIYYTATATPAIQTYAVSIPISPRHRPQNLLSAISGGGELQDFTLVARGDPVVVAENGMPCASDMTHGRIEVTATTAAYDNESSPTAGSGFTLTAEPYSNSGTGYKQFTASVRKELT